ncbi:MAG: tetratricopeptide repeat protein, partial [Acidobacteriota bacterium]
DQRTLWLHRLLLWGLYTLLVSGALFVIVQMAAKGSDLFVDLRRLLGGRLPPMASALLVVALLIAPIALPSGLMWLLLWWSVLLWGYGSASERTVLIALWLMLGLVSPLLQLQHRTIATLQSSMRAVTAIGEGRLYGGLFADLGALRLQLPDEPAVAELIADLHWRLGQIDYARARYLEQLETEPSRATVLNNLGVFHHNQEDFSNAINYFEQAIGADPALAEAFFNLSQSYSQSYAFSNSREALAQAKALDSTRVDAWLENEGKVVPVEGSQRRLQDIQRALLRADEAASDASLIDAPAAADVVAAADGSTADDAATDAAAGAGVAVAADALAPAASVATSASAATIDVAALMRDRSFLVAACTLIAALLLHLIRRPFGYVLGRARFDRGSSRAALFEDWLRVLVPGLGSAIEGHGLRCLLAILLPVALVLLPVMRWLGYRMTVAYAGDGHLFFAVSLIAVSAIFLLRMRPLLIDAEGI